MGEDNIDFKERKHIHFTGIKGVGQTALSLCAEDLGIKVTGSDVEERFVTDETLKKAGIDYKVGFRAKNVSDSVDLLVTTGAHKGYENPEYQYAQKKGIVAVSYAKALGSLANTKKVITMVGVGGKSTISSMLATVFDYGGLNPSFVVGVGSINPLGRPGRYDEGGTHFICEGDEYVVSPGIDNRAKFLLLKPEIVVVSNIEHDHPDIYKNVDETLKVFGELFGKISKKGLLVACMDNDNVRKVVNAYQGKLITYGFSSDADYVISQYTVKNRQTIFRLKNNKSNVSIILKVPGRFNALNAAAAFIVSKHVGLTQGKIVRGLYKYRGCRRRFEYIGKFKGVEIYDDYAHHPKEINAFLESAREWFAGKRLVVVFQPHTYSRTKALYEEFVESLSKADVVGIMDIYASAREKKDSSVSSDILVKSINKNKNEVYYTGGHGGTLKWIKKTLEKDDILLTVGAGDIFHLHEKLVN